MYLLRYLNLAVLVMPVASAAYQPRVGGVYRRTYNGRPPVASFSQDQSTEYIIIAVKAIYATISSISSEEPSSISVKDKSSSIAPIKDQSLSTVSTIPAKDQTDNLATFPVYSANDQTTSVIETFTVPTKDPPSFSSALDKDDTIPDKDRTSSSIATVPFKDQTTSLADSTATPAKDFPSSSYVLAKDSTVPAKDRTSSSATWISSMSATSASTTDQIYTLTTLTVVPIQPTQDLTSSDAGVVSIFSKDQTTMATDSSTPTKDLPSSSNAQSKDKNTHVAHTSTTYSGPSSNVATILTRLDTTSTIHGKDLTSAEIESTPVTDMSSTSSANENSSIVIISVQTSHLTPSRNETPTSNSAAFPTQDQSTLLIKNAPSTLAVSSRELPSQIFYTFTTVSVSSNSTTLSAVTTAQGAPTMTVSFHMPLPPASGSQFGSSFTFYPSGSEVSSDNSPQSSNQVETSRSLVFTRTSYPNTTWIVYSSPAASANVSMSSSKFENIPSTVPTFPEVTYHTTIPASCMPSCKKSGSSVIIQTLSPLSTTPGLPSETGQFSTQAPISTYPGQGMASNDKPESFTKAMSFESVGTATSLISNITYSFTLSPMAVSSNSGTLPSGEPGSTFDIKTSGSSNSIPFAAPTNPSSISTYSPSQVTILPLSSTSEFTSTISSSTVPVYTPGMLGNAYGGGYIVTPSLLAVISSTTTGSVTGVPPGYGFSIIPGVSTPVGGSIILAATTTILGMDVTSVANLPSPLTTLDISNGPDVVFETSQTTSTQMAASIPRTSSTSILGKNSILETTILPGKEGSKTESTTSSIMENPQTLAITTLATSANTPESVSSVAQAEIQSLQTASNQVLVSTPGFTGSSIIGETSVSGTIIVPGEAPLSEATATSTTDYFQTSVTTTMTTPVNTPESPSSFAMAETQTLQTVSRNGPADTLESAGNSVIGGVSVLESTAVPGESLISESTTGSIPDNYPTLMITTMATSVVIPTPLSNITFTIPSQPSPPEVFQGIGTSLDEGVLTPLIIMLALVVYL